jgi:hypothetical protein
MLYLAFTAPSGAGGRRTCGPRRSAYLTGRELWAEDGPGQRFPWAWAVGHIAEHESSHLGKCMLLRNLLPQRPGP